MGGDQFWISDFAESLNEGLPEVRAEEASALNFGARSELSKTDFKLII